MNHGRLLSDAFRQLAYHMQRTGNPRCEAQGIKIHEKLDALENVKRIQEIIERLRQQVRDRDQTIAKLEKERNQVVTAWARGRDRLREVTEQKAILLSVLENAKSSICDHVWLRDTVLAIDAAIAKVKQE